MIRKKTFKRIFCKYSHLYFNSINAQIICKRHVYITTVLDEKSCSEESRLNVLHIDKGAEATCLILMVVQTARLNGLCPDRYVKYLLENYAELSDERITKKYFPCSRSILDSVRFTKTEMVEQRKLWRRI